MSAGHTPWYQRSTMLVVLQASIPLRLRIWVFVPCVLMLSLAVLGPRVAHDVPNSAIYLMPFSLMSIALVWHMWVGRLALMQSQAASLCLPGLSAVIGRTVAIAVVLTVLTPCVFFTLSGVAPVWAWSLPVIAALWGLLAALSPTLFAWMLLLMPIVGPALGEMIAARLGMQFRVHAIPPWTALACVGVVIPLVAWRWRVVADVRDPQRISRWGRAILFKHVPHAVDTGDSPPPHRNANTRLASVAGPTAQMRADHAGPHNVRAAIGACFGGDLGTRTTHDSLKQWGLLTGFVIVMVANPLSATSLAYMRDALLWGSVGGTLAFGWVLARGVQVRQQRMSGPQPELALLPGLGGPETARRAMLGLMLRQLARLLVFMLAGLALAAWTRQVPPTHIFWLAVLWLGVGAGSLMLCLRALAGRSLVSISALMMMVPLIVLGTITMTLAFLRIPETRFIPILMIAWPLVISAYLGLASGLLQHYRARPHPFLLQ